MGSLQQPRSPLDVAIIGAGIGGLSLAIGLLKENVPFTIYERADSYSTVGAGVGLGPNALRAMEAIDPRFKKLYDTIATGNLTPNKEHVMMELLPLAPGLGGDDFKPIPVESVHYIRTGCHRKELLDIMTSLIPAKSVRFNKRVRSLEQKDGKVVVNFEDGEVVEANAVIGCDGAKGATRAAVLGEKYPELVRAKYSGKYVYRSMVPMKEAKEIIGNHAGDGKWFMGKGANFTTFSVSKGTMFNIVAFKFDNKESWTHDHWTKEVSKEEMLADFTSIATGVDSRLVQLLDWAKPLQWAIHHHLETPVYYNRSICLLGDSAHASTPHQASGAGQCIEDALILSRILGRVTSLSQLPAAFKVYDEIRRPRAQEVVRTSQEAGLLYTYQDPVCGSDIFKVAENLNNRFLWIWNHDLEKDIKEAVDGFYRSVGQEREGFLTGWLRKSGIFTK